MDSPTDFKDCVAKDALHNLIVVEGTYIIDRFDELIRNMKSGHAD